MLLRSATQLLRSPIVFHGRDDRSSLVVRDTDSSKNRGGVHEVRVVRFQALLYGVDRNDSFEDSGI